MKKIAIIPARGGSKRIPRKNIKPFLGQPIMAYSIQAALDSGLFDEVMVSTDDAEIAKIALSYGAAVPFMRSKKNADDHAGTAEVLLEVILAYADRGLTYDFGCCIYPTAPFTTPQLLNQAYQKLIQGDFDTVFSALPFSFPIQRAIKIQADDRIQMFQPEYLTTRSQDLERAYHDAGQFYWFKVASLVQQRQLWTDRSSVVVLRESQAQDIDHPEDWRIAELKYKLMQDGAD